MIITYQHVRQMRYCAKGTRAFFERHGLDWSQFLKVGLPEELILATGDTMAIKLVQQVKK